VNPAEIARKAAQIISEKGLAKGNLVDNQGRVCHNGAIYEASVGQPNQFDESGLAQRIIMASTKLLATRGITASSPPAFNDDPSTTAEDVILHLKELAVWLEENELPELEVRTLPGDTGMTMNFYIGGGGSASSYAYTIPMGFSSPVNLTFSMGEVYAGGGGVGYSISPEAEITWKEGIA
jgi:hypothetical protein